jgi:hypothetical protein
MKVHVGEHGAEAFDRRVLVETQETYANGTRAFHQRRDLFMKYLACAMAVLIMSLPTFTLAGDPEVLESIQSQCSRYPGGGRKLRKLGQAHRKVSSRAASGCPTSIGEI